MLQSKNEAKMSVLAEGDLAEFSCPRKLTQDVDGVHGSPLSSQQQFYTIKFLHFLPRRGFHPQTKSISWK